MSSINSVSLVGNLTKDTDIRTTTSGMVVASNTIAINGVKEDDVSFVDLTFFGKTAEVLNNYTVKGNKIGVVGRLKQESWDDKATGQKRSKLVVIVNDLMLLTPKSDNQSHDTLLTQSKALNNGKDFIVKDLPNNISLSDIPF